MQKGIFLYTEDFQRYDMGEDHPLKPVRIHHTYELLRCIGALGAADVREPTPCPLEALKIAHSQDYITVTDRLSSGQHVPSYHRYGFGSGDNPVFPGMWEASLLYTGASLDAAQAVMDGAPVAMNLSGGLHHAHYDRAAGFCVFNDAVVAIQRLRQQFERVAYVDIDVHHGDGVQEAFYDDPSVLTLSIHQTGQTLFPHSGYVQDSGIKEGAGYSVNIPLWPYTEDEIWLEAWRKIAVPVLKLFNPQVIVLQLGADAHYLDPLAQICLTALGWLEAVKDIHAMDLPVVALGGGGYNQMVVPRMWTLAYCELFDMPWNDEIPSCYPYHLVGHTLTDHERPACAPHDRNVVRDYAAKTIQSLQERFLV